jgi:hypothetical protein
MDLGLRGGRGCPVVRSRQPGQAWWYLRPTQIGLRMVAHATSAVNAEKGLTQGPNGGARLEQGI